MTDPKTLRDEFAMAALTGLLAGTLSDGHSFDFNEAPSAAEAAYVLADAMLLARKRETEE